MEVKKERVITVDGSLKAYTKTNKGVREVVNVKSNEITNNKSDLDAEKLIALGNEFNKRLITVDIKKGVEAGYYYKVEDVVDWLWQIRLQCNTVLKYNEKSILTKKEFASKLVPSIPASLMLKTETGHFITQEALNEIFNNLSGTPDFLALNANENAKDGYISKFESEMIENGDLKVKIKVVLNKQNKNTRKENVSKQQPSSNSDVYYQEQNKRIENDPYESQYSNYSQPTQTNNGINTTANYIKKTIEDYINEDEPEIELRVDYKKKSNLTPEEKKKIRNTIIATALATATIILSTVSLVGRKNNEKPQPLPESSPTPTATIDLSSVAENPNGEEIIKAEITDEDLYEYIDLGASYYISDNANLYRSGIDTTRAGVTTAGDAKVTSIIICESKKDIEGNTVLENKQTINLNDGNLSETNLGKIYNQWLKNVEGNNFVIKVHLSRKNEVTNQEEGYGWVEVNKETFNDLYESLQNSNKITYQ